MTVLVRTCPSSSECVVSSAGRLLVKMSMDIELSETSPPSIRRPDSVGNVSPGVGPGARVSASEPLGNVSPGVGPGARVSASEPSASEPAWPQLHGQWRST